MCSFVIFLIHRDYLATKITNYKHSLNILVNENEIRQGFEIERVKPLISDPANAHSTNDTVYVFGQDEGYTVKFTPWPEGVPMDKARQRGIFYRVS